MSEQEFPDGKIRFEIEALGPIRDSVLDFKPFLLFSGESNTGKSYAAMAVYSLFYLLHQPDKKEKLTEKLFDIEKIRNEFKSKKKVRIESPKRLSTELEKLYNTNISRFMAYMLGSDGFSCKVKLKLNTPEPDEPISISLKEEDGPDSIFISSVYGENCIPSNLVRTLRSAVSVLCNNLVFGKNSRNRFFMPPARGAFSGLTPSMREKFSGIGMYKEFLELFDTIWYRGFVPDDELINQIDFIGPLFEKLLNGKIEVERENVSYTLSGSGNKIPLTAASSSVKELFPLYLLLNRILINTFSICIEEPEAHLHPDLQRSAARLLSYIVNQGGFVQATTHSDFFVNQVNNLIKLHFINDKAPDRFQMVLKETGIAEEFVVNPGDIAPYYFKKGEKVKDPVRAERLEISEKGMLMRSFEPTYDQSVKETRYLREVLTDDEE